MVVKINMEMPKSCHMCPFSSFFSLWSRRKICLLELGIQQYKEVVLREPFTAWIKQPEVKEGEKLPNCPLQESNE